MISDEPGLSILVISGSGRDERVGPTIANWVAGELAERPDVDVEVVDVGELVLPPHAELRPGVSHPWPLAGRIGAADGYVVVTPEYNHGYPAALKQFIDAHYGEWMFKAAMLVSYGVSGGLLAAEQLRGVFAELCVVTTRRVVAVSAPWGREVGGRLDADGRERAALDRAWSELRWWATAAKHQRSLEPFGPRREAAQPTP